MTPVKQSNEELAGEMGRRLLKIVAASALFGGSLRGGMSVLRNANARYDPPEVPKPTIVDMPYPVPAAPTLKSIPAAGNEKKFKPALKAAADTAYPDWAKNLGAAGRGLHDVLPTYTPPTGNPGETNPSNVPLYGAATVGAGVLGLGAGFKLTDKMLVAADRWKARKDLEAAKKEYQEAVTRRLAGTKLAAKSAATDAPTPEALVAKEAIDKLYAAVKLAGDPVPNSNPDPLSRTVAAALWPGLIGGPGAAQANAAIAAAAGGLGGYMGYNFTRDPEAHGAVRRRVKEIDRANADKLRAPLIGRLVPVPQST